MRIKHANRKERKKEKKNMDFIDSYIAAGTYFQGLSEFVIVDYSLFYY